MEPPLPDGGGQLVECQQGTDKLKQAGLLRRKGEGQRSHKMVQHSVAFTWVSFERFAELAKAKSVSGKDFTKPLRTYMKINLQ